MIKLTEVTKVFDSRGIAGLHCVSLDIPKGCIFALMGPNGSGKTTLLNVISSKLVLDSGDLKVDGQIHFFEKKSPEPELNVQRFLMESVTNPDIETDKKLQLSRDMASIFEFTFQLRQNISQLSQGQLQKVLMAAELINSPDILFLDEPFVHLDPMSRKDILESLFIFLRQRETTVIWITHEKDEALRFSDEVCLMQHGKLEQVSTPIRMLMQPKNLFVAQYFGHQNFFSIIKDSHGWQTPWGLTHDLPETSLSEGFLIVPPSSWILNKESEFEGEIISLYPQYFLCELEVEVKSKVYRVSLPLKQFSKFEKGQMIKLSPDLSQCLIIGL